MSLSGAPSSRAVLAALRAMGGVAESDPRARGRQSGPFITIARQGGAPAIPLARHLAERLNAEKANADRRWQAYDRELIEHVAHELNLPESVVANVHERPRSFLLDVAAGLQLSTYRPTDERIYREVMTTIRRLAQLGRAILVGRGSVYCTQDLPHGIHVQLIAPFADRVRYIVESRHVSRDEAERWVRETERKRHDFLAQFWPDHDSRPEAFTVTFNTAEVPLDLQLDTLVRLVHAKTPATP